MRITVTAAVLTLALALPTAAAAAPITITGEFTSFRTWILVSGRPAGVNGVPLTPGAGPAVGTNGSTDYVWSDLVPFAPGTTTVGFQYDSPPNRLNSFEYTAPHSLDVELGETFWFGNVTFTNGQWFPEAELGFTLRTQSADSALDGHVFNGTIRLISVEGDGIDAHVGADFFYMAGSPGMGSCRVFDAAFPDPPSGATNVGTCSIFGHIGSLIPTAFVAANSSAFTNPSITPDLVAVPEPALLLLLGAGVSAYLRRRTKA